jgi:UDP-N-acetylmuramyl pentapeptide phosphotransferase/UDP-N-acetylglucosamine-1-phosphate transferase
LNLAVFCAAFAGAALLCNAALPWLRRAFLVTPGARSSHIEATPQGGGLIVAPLAMAIAWAALLATGWRPGRFDASLLAALLALVALGCVDDLSGLSARLRFIVQAGAAALVLFALPDAPVPILAWLPPSVAALALLIGAVWFVNLTNFMDGIDLLSVAEFVPAFALIALLAPDGISVGALCVAFCGTLLGFALLNRPPARLFLGDSGSLPLGLLGAAGALVVAGRHGIIVASLPFLYYCADATLTLARRALAGEKVWQAHKQHFYQRALQRGLGVRQIVARVAACNIALCAVALVIVGRGARAHWTALAFASVLVALLLRDLARQRV